MVKNMGTQISPAEAMSMNRAQRRALAKQNGIKRIPGSQMPFINHLKRARRAAGK